MRIAHSLFRHHWLSRGLAAALVLFVYCFAYGQVEPEAVTLSVQKQFIGFGGQVRPGEWAGAVMEIEFKGSQEARVRCQWLLTDADGDEVVYQRLYTLTRNSKNKYWIYGKLPMSTSDRTLWRFQVVDDETERLLAAEEISTPEILTIEQSLIGLVSGGQPLGLAPYSENLTQHEELQINTTLNVRLLPDRWYGYNMMQTIIWAPRGGDPMSPEISSATYKAVRNWVRRGGHLVISMPAIGETWTSSPWRDLLQPVEFETVTQQPAPASLGFASGPDSAQINIDYVRVQPKQGSEEVVDVLLREKGKDDGAPIVVGYPVGLGRVTVCGVDLTDRRVTRLKLPNGRLFWNTIFAWRNPVLPAHEIKRLTEERKIYPMHMRNSIDLSRFIPGLIAMKGTFKAALVLALFFFGMYWLLAGPGSFILLKQKNKEKYAWFGFLAVVGVVTAIAWAGASFMRPLESRIEHFSVVTAHASTSEIRTHSWLSLFKAEHGDLEVSLKQSDNAQASNAISAPGMSMATNVFLDSRRYVINAGDPGSVDVPYRSTAKQFEMDWFGSSAATEEQFAEQWKMPRGELRMKDGWPTGSLIHNLPSALTDCLVIFCPGGGQEPVVWRHRDPWNVGQPMLVNRAAASAGGVERVVARISDSNWAGFLWKKMGNKPMHRLSEQELELLRVADDDMRNGSELLSLYSTMPPPAWWREITSSEDAPIHYYRSLGRELDLTRYLSLRCLIVLGYLEKSPLPMPLDVDGEPLPATGWTVVRWVSPVAPAKATNDSEATEEQTPSGTADDSATDERTEN